MHPQAYMGRNEAMKLITLTISLAVLLAGCFHDDAADELRKQKAENDKLNKENAESALRGIHAPSSLGKK